MRRNRMVTACLAVLGMGLCAGISSAAVSNTLFVSDDSFPAGPLIDNGFGSLVPSLIAPDGSYVLQTDLVSTAYPSTFETGPVVRTNDFQLTTTFYVEGLTTQLYSSGPALVKPEVANTPINTKIELFRNGTDLLATVNGIEGTFAPLTLPAGDYSIVTTYTTDDGTKLATRNYYANTGLFFQPGAGTTTANLNAGNAIVAVPEPATMGVLVVGAAGLLLRRRKR